MNKTKLSILIPLYNNINGIKNILVCLEKISCESAKFIEIIISDDSDNPLIETKNINNLKAKFNKFDYQHNNPKLGAAKNWNKLINISLGDYFWLLHHDEYWNNDKDFIKFIINDLDKKKRHLCFTN